MARFHGMVGYAETYESAPDVFSERIVEYPYFGDVKQDLRKNQPTDQIHDSVIQQNLVEILGDKYAFDHYYAMRYVLFNGVRWEVGYVEVRYPRLWIRFGKVYNGPIPTDSVGEPPEGDVGD